jgi:hypothetical protein
MPKKSDTEIKYVLELTEYEYLVLLAAVGASTGRSPEGRPDAAYNIYTALADADRQKTDELRAVDAFGPNPSWAPYAIAADKVAK